MKKAIALLGAVAALALSTVATAASATSFLWSFAGTGGTTGAFGTVEATDNMNGSFTVTSGTINAFGTVISGSGTLIPNPDAPNNSISPSGSFSYDNILLPNTDPLLNLGGLLFKISGFEVNIWATGPGPDGYIMASNNGNTVTGNFALSQIGSSVPEPATWVMMLAGFGMVGAGVRARQRATVRVTYA